jgi:MYXO-CTERM domain-containing protein
MKKITILLSAFTVCCFLSTVPSATFAQEQNTTAQSDNDDDDDKDYGWIGLIGLAGLLGLRKRDHVVDRDVRTGNRV